MSKQRLFLIVLGFFGMHQAFGQNYIGDAKEIQHILKNVKKFSEYVMAGDHENIGNAYTEDAKIFPNGKPIIEGKEEIINYWKTPEGYSTPYHKITPQEIKIMGDEAYDYGLYEGRSQNPNGEESSWKGKYVIVWKKINGDWKVYLDIWNGIRD